MLPLVEAPASSYFIHSRRQLVRTSDLDILLGKGMVYILVIWTNLINGDRVETIWIFSSSQPSGNHEGTDVGT